VQAYPHQLVVPKYVKMLADMMVYVVKACNMRAGVAAAKICTDPSSQCLTKKTVGKVACTQAAYNALREGNSANILLRFPLWSRVW